MHQPKNISISGGGGGGDHALNASLHSTKAAGIKRITFSTVRENMALLLL
jgi:hypothetical protein